MKDSITKQSIIAILLCLLTSAMLAYLVRAAGLDVKGLLVISFCALTFYLLVKMPNDGNRG